MLNYISLYSSNWLTPNVKQTSLKTALIELLMIYYSISIAIMLQALLVVVLYYLRCCESHSCRLLLSTRLCTGWSVVGQCWTRSTVWRQIAWFVYLVRSRSASTAHLLPDSRLCYVTASLILRDSSVIH